jgi:heptosyltransferase-2
MSKTIAVILPNWIGDAVMATPALQCLRDWAGSDARIEGFGPSGICDLLAGLPALNALNALPGRGLPLSRMFVLAQRLRAGRFDCALLLSNGLGIAVAAWAAGVSERAGYVRRGRRVFLSRALLPPKENGRFLPIPAIDYYLALAQTLGAAQGRPPMMLATSAGDEAAASALWSVFADRQDRITVILNNNAARSEAKLWPVESMAELARRVAGLDVNVMVLGAPGHEARAQRTAALAGHTNVRVATPIGLGPLKSCLRRAALVVTTDSGVRSIAAAFGIPLVSLFGPTDPCWTLLHVANETMIEAREPRNMAALPVERVWQAVCAQLGPPQAR